MLEDMHEDVERCVRAVQSKDARFDGWFFTGVVTTGIYCRPVCPARTSKRSNIRFYATAAAAAEAGYRPCLRCRPEAAPGTPAWLGTSAIVRRVRRDPRSVRRVLDVGCGTGLVLQEVGKWLGIEVVGAALVEWLPTWKVTNIL